MRNLSLALALLAPVAAGAQEAPPFPNWPPRDECERQLRVLRSESAVILRGCLDHEDRAAAELRAGWDAMPARVRRECLRQQGVLRMASYVILKGCTENELAALRDIERRR
jgi:hypothetical protein